MLKLYGFPVSNYVNMVNLALLEKGVPFDYVLTIPDQSPEFLAKSPRGKVPCLETPQGFITEASVILEYLEETVAGKALLPEAPFERAQVRALMKEIELYIELPARACFGEAFFGAILTDAIKLKARDELVAGFPLRGRRAIHTGRHPLPLQRRSGCHRRPDTFRTRPARRLRARPGTAATPWRESERDATGRPAR